MYMDIYIELIKTLICMCVNFLSSFSYVTTQVSVYFVAKIIPWVYKHAKQCFNLVIPLHVYENKTPGHFKQLKGNAYFLSIFKFLAVKSSKHLC